MDPGVRPNPNGFASSQWNISFKVLGTVLLLTERNNVNYLVQSDPFDTNSNFGTNSNCYYSTNFYAPFELFGKMPSFGHNWISSAFCVIYKIHWSRKPGVYKINTVNMQSFVRSVIRVVITIDASIQTHKHNEIACT